MLAWILSKLSPTVYLMIALALLSGAFYLYFKHSQNVIVALNKEIALKDVAIERSKAVIKQMESDIATIKKINAELKNVEVADEIQRDKLSKTLKKLDKVSKKAGLVEKLVNKASKDRNACMAAATGKKITKNRVCPQLGQK